MAFWNVSHLLIVCIQVIAYSNMYTHTFISLQFSNAPFYETRQVVYTVRLQCFFFFPRKLYKNTCNTAYMYSTYNILFRRYRYNVWRKYIVLHCCSMHILLTPFTIHNALPLSGGGRGWGRWRGRGEGGGEADSDTNKRAYNFFSEIISSVLIFLYIECVVQFVQRTSISIL
jgi:hypothetical protein